MCCNQRWRYDTFNINFMQNKPATTLILLSACFTPTPKHKTRLANAMATMPDWETAKNFVIDRQGAGLVLRKPDELGLTNLPMKLQQMRMCYTTHP